MEPSNWEDFSEIAYNRYVFSCCSKAIFIMAQNDQIKVYDLCRINFLKIKNTEKVFEKLSQN